MKQLHPRAVWLFFVRFLMMGILFLVWAVGFSMAWIILAASWGLLCLYLLMAIIAVSVISYIWAKLSYHYYRYELAEDAFKTEKGVIWKRYVSIPYGRIQNVDIYRGVWARLLGLSDIQIQTAGYGAAGAARLGSEGRLPGLAKEEAEKVREEIMKKIKSQPSGL